MRFSGLILYVYFSLTLYQEMARPGPLTGLHFTFFDPSSVKI